MRHHHAPSREAVETRIDAPLGPALRLAVAMGGADVRERAIARAHNDGRDRDARAAVARLADARAAQLRGAGGHVRIPAARRALLAARRAGLAAVTNACTNV